MIKLFVPQPPLNQFYNSPLFQPQPSVHRSRYLPRNMTDEDQGLPRPQIFIEPCLGKLNGLLIQPLKRLVKNEEFRGFDKGADQQDEALLAGREVCEGAIGQRADLEIDKQVADAGLLI